MKHHEFTEATEIATRQRATSAWLAEWLAGVVRQSTGRTVGEISDGYNSVRIDLVLDAKELSRLAEHERDCNRYAELMAA